jgi:hypothetical protein
MEPGRERRGEARQGDNRNGRSRTIRGAPQPDIPMGFFAR